MESIFLVLVLFIGAYFCWKKITTKNFLIDKNSETFGFIRLFLFVIFYPLMTMGTVFLLIEIFPELKKDKALSVFIFLIVGVAWFYLIGKFEDSTHKKPK